MLWYWGGMYYTSRSCRQRCIKSRLMVAPMAFHLNSASRANPPNRDAIIDWVEKDSVDLGGWERVAIGRHNPSYLRRICSALTSSTCTPPPTTSSPPSQSPPPPSHPPPPPPHSTFSSIIWSPKPFSFWISLPVSITNLEDNLTHIYLHLLLIHLHILSSD